MKNDLSSQELARLAAAPQKHAPKRKAAPASKRYLFGAAAVLIAGAVLVILRGGRAPAILSDAVTGAPEAQTADQNAMPGGSAAPVVAVQTAPQLRNAIWYARREDALRVRPPNYLQKLAGGHPLPKFVPVDALEFKGDKPLTVYVLLRARLDDYTEGLWQKAGLVNDLIETQPLLKNNPFLRKVVIRDAEALTYLTDWHVESVALSLQ